MTRRIEIDGERVTVEISESLDAQQLTELLHQLGEMRAKIANDPTSVLGLTVRVTPDPVYWAEPDIDRRSARIFFRDGRFGWLGYLIPAVELARLTGILTAQLKMLTGEIPGESAAPPGPRH